MKKLIIDPTIATRLDLNPIRFSEDRKFKFTAPVDWPGTYAVKFYNSSAKNNEVGSNTSGALTVVGTVMTLNIYPEQQSFPVSLIYYEIIRTDLNHIYIIGELNIIK